MEAEEGEGEREGEGELEKDEKESCDEPGESELAAPLPDVPGVQGTLPPGDGTGLSGAVLTAVVQCILAGVHIMVLLGWLLGKVSEALTWILDSSLMVLQPPQ